jgi:endonuclease/exonuclease/phosphatase family metal-dependent hydrolase
VNRHPNVGNAIIAGDFNADCDYVRDPDLLTLFNDQSNEWIIPFSADTTVKDTDCAYDHIILYGDIQNNQQNAGVFNYQTFYDTDNIFYEDESITELISDHFPVEFEFY